MSEPHHLHHAGNGRRIVKTEQAIEVVTLGVIIAVCIAMLVGLVTASGAVHW